MAFRQDTVILKNLITNPVYRERVMGFIEPKYFRVPAEEVLFLMIRSHAAKYEGSAPALDTLAVQVGQYCGWAEGSRDYEQAMETLKAMESADSEQDLNVLIDKTDAWVKQEARAIASQKLACQLGGDNPSEERWQAAMAELERASAITIKVSPEDAIWARFRRVGDGIESPRQKWLIKGVIPAEGYGSLNGRWGTAKTFVVIDLAMQIARAHAGDRFCGALIKRPGAVVMFCYEGFGTISERVEALVKAKYQGLDLAETPFYWLPGGPDAMGIEGQRYVRESLDVIRRKHGAVSLVIFDTASAAFTFATGQNHDSDVQKAWNVLRDLSAEYETFALVVDHFGKDESRGARGSVTKLNNVDSVLNVFATENDDGVVSRHVNVEKNRSGVSGQSFYFDLEEVTLLEADEDGEPVIGRFIKWLLDEDGKPIVPVEGGKKKVADGPAWKPGEIARWFREALLDELEQSKMLRGDPDETGTQVRVADLGAVKGRFKARYESAGRDWASGRRLINKTMAEAVEAGLVTIEGSSVWITLLGLGVLLQESGRGGGAFGRWPQAIGPGLSAINFGETGLPQ
jgi:KaiC/GvpD/RAD55 family RecA-like ATPase